MCWYSAALQSALLFGCAVGRFKGVCRCPDELPFPVFEDFVFVNLVSALVHFYAILYVVTFFSYQVRYILV